MKNNWLIQGARLQEVIDYTKLTQKEFAASISAHQSNISLAIAGKRGISIEMLMEISNQYLINTDWLITGQGQMLKSHNVAAEVSPEDNFFSGNLAVLMQAHQLDADNLSSLIRTDTLQITDLLEGRREPSISQLIRLRRALDISIDDLLLEDLSQVDSMDNLNTSLRNEAQQKAILEELEKLQEQVQKMLERQQQQEAEIKNLKKDRDDEERKIP